MPAMLLLTHQMDAIVAQTEDELRREIKNLKDQLAVEAACKKIAENRVLDAEEETYQALKARNLAQANLCTALDLINEYRAGVIRRKAGYSKLYLKCTKFVEELKYGS